MPTVSFTIDGKSVSCERDTMLLEVARASGFEIPALCHHEAAPAYGACRLCLVEITQGRWNWVEISCTYPVRDDGIEVLTDSEKVRRYRRLNMELLLARCPDSETVRRLAQQMGVEGTRLPADGDTACILCGLCVQMCCDAVGAGAISFVGRGARRRVQTPYDEPSPDCIGCGACGEVCPTGHITIVDDPDRMTRRVEPFHTEHRLVPCPQCGRGYVTERQLEFLRQRLGEKAGDLDACPVCRSKARALELCKAYQTTQERL